MIPLPGVSVIDQYQQDPGMLDPEWVRAGREWSHPEKWRELADRFLFHDVPPGERDWAHTTVRPMRTENALREPLNAPTIAPVPSVCVICSLERTIVPAWQERTWTAAGGGAIIRLEAGHCPHVSLPRETAEAILSVC